ncbi:MAG: type III pantothenate kinase [Gammaproteobacteria bacterium]
MLLCIDVGNSHIFGGVFADDKLLLRFRYPTKRTSSDELGLFLRGVLRENALDQSEVKQISICSVVPDLEYSLRSACRKYFHIDPFFLKAGVKTGLKIKYCNPVELGADRVANAIAAHHFYPQQDMIIVDFGTATTLCALSKRSEYLSGAILPGIRLAMDALQSKTAKLPPVEIIKPDLPVGRTTVESIQAGLYFGTLGAVREVISRIQNEILQQSSPLVLATGGFAQLFEQEKLFNEIMPDLVLHGLRVAFYLNQSQL